VLDGVLSPGEAEIWGLPTYDSPGGQHRSTISRRVIDFRYLATPFSIICLSDRNKNFTNRRCRKIFTVRRVEILKYPHNVGWNETMVGPCKIVVDHSRSELLCSLVSLRLQGIRFTAFFYFCVRKSDACYKSVCLQTEQRSSETL